MKKMILFFVLLSGCITAVLAAESKIAIIGDSPLAEKAADLALTELSDKKGIVVLERSEIDKLLREHKLTRLGMTAMQLASFARIAHVDIFAVINSAIKNKRKVLSSLLVFDAKTGFKLCDLSLSGQLEKDVKTISMTITAARAQLQQTKRMSYVAILAVRNAGVPSKYKYNMENIATEVRRRLVAAPDIAVLERSRLGLVLKERKLSKNQYKLLPSAYLLDFEFSQGSAANIVNLKLYVMSTNGKILKKYAYANSLGKTSELISKIINDLSKWLNKPLSVDIISAKAEAKRYFGEYGFYKQLKKYQIAKCKLESAIALDPNNIKYLVEYQKAIVNAVTSGRRMSRKKRLGEYVKAGYAIISNRDLIHNLAPDNREWIFNQHTLFEKMYNLYEWQNRERNPALTSPKQLRLAAENSENTNAYILSFKHQ